MTHFSKGSWSFPLIYPEYQVSSSSCTFSMHRVHFILFCHFTSEKEGEPRRDCDLTLDQIGKGYIYVEHTSIKLSSFQSESQSSKSILEIFPFHLFSSYYISYKKSVRANIYLENVVRRKAKGKILCLKFQFFSQGCLLFMKFQSRPPEGSQNIKNELLHARR